MLAECLVCGKEEVEGLHPDFAVGLLPVADGLQDRSVSGERTSSDGENAPRWPTYPAQTMASPGYALFTAPVIPVASVRREELSLTEASTDSTAGSTLSTHASASWVFCDRCGCPVDAELIHP